MPHTLYVEKATTLMPATPTPAGQARTQKFYAAGEYRVRDEEYPHIDGTVIVVQTPYVARLDEKGNFKLDVPEGKYTMQGVLPRSLGGDAGARGRPGTRAR